MGYFVVQLNLIVVTRTHSIVTSATSCKTLNRSFTHGKSHTLYEYSGSYNDLDALVSERTRLSVAITILLPEIWTKVVLKEKMGILDSVEENVFAYCGKTDFRQRLTVTNNWDELIVKITTVCCLRRGNW